MDDQGKEWNKAFLQKDGFAMATPNMNEKSTTNIQALLDTQLFCISIEDWLQTGIQFPELKDMHHTIMMQYMNEKSDREINLQTKDAISA